MLRGVAPSAIRTPSSRVRRPTAWASVPYSPSAVSSVAKAEKAPSRSIEKRCIATDCVAVSRIVRRSMNAWSGSTEAAARRSAGVSRSGSFTDVRTTSAPPLSGFCRYGRYSSAIGAAPMPSWLTSPATPTTSFQAGAPPAAGKAIRWPTGFRPGQKRRAIVRFTITTDGASASSCGVKARPWRSGIPIVSK